MGDLDPPGTLQGPWDPPWTHPEVPPRYCPREEVLGSQGSPWRETPRGGAQDRTRVRHLVPPLGLSDPGDP